MKYVASCSFGKDSLAMVLKLIEEKEPLDYVVFYDTGMEFDAIYRIRDKMKTVLSSHNITYVELHPSEPFLYTMLERPVTSRKTGEVHYGYQWCGGVCRWGTARKTQAIMNFKNSLNDVVIDYVGIAADEQRRFHKAEQDGKILPLVRWGMTEHDCLQYCRDHGFRWTEHTDDGDIDLYDILDRVSCWCCSNKNLKELRNIYSYLPSYWQRLKNLQHRIDRPFKGYSSRGDRCGIDELECRFEIEKNSQSGK